MNVRGSGAVVTGGGNGIGRALARRLAATSMLAGTGRAGDVVLQAAAIEPGALADALWDGMTDGRFLILPHPEVADYYARRPG